MISQTAEYALRAVVYLAMHRNSAFTTHQISTGTKVPEAYLSKVLHSLVKANLVQSQRGVGGGFVLTKSAHELSIYEVINAVDPIQRILTCPLGLKEHGTNLCALHKRLDDASSLIETDFRQTSLADLLENPTKSIPLGRGSE